MDIVDIIVLLCLVSYMVIAAIIIGIADGKGESWGPFCGFLWPFLVIAGVCLILAYLPYKLAFSLVKNNRL